MEENKNSVKLGDGVGSSLKQTANQEISDIGNAIIKTFAEFIKGKINEIDLNELFSKKNKEELLNLWSDQLAQKGLISGGYVGLPDELLIQNSHQEGYMDGLYAGYAMALAAMADQGVQKENIISVRDALRPNLLGHVYEKRAEFTDLLKNEKYEWIEKS